MATQGKKRGEEKQAPQRQSRSSGREEQSDLKTREYRDAQGNVHHHTRKYMQDHARDKKD